MTGIKVKRSNCPRCNLPTLIIFAKCSECGEEKLTAVSNPDGADFTPETEVAAAKEVAASLPCKNPADLATVSGPQKLKTPLGTITIDRILRG